MSQALETLTEEQKAAFRGYIGATDTATAVAAATGALDVDLETFGQGLGADVWADSAAASDLSTGLSRPRSKKALAAAVALLGVSLSSLALPMGSVWRETLNVTGDYEVVTSGTGEIAVIDGSDIVTGWTPHATQANLWEKSVTHEIAGNTSARGQVFINGEPLTRKANDAAANAAPLSFVEYISSGGPTQTIKINPGVGVNPNTSDMVIEVVVRDAALVSQPGTSVAIRGPLEVRRALSNNGALYLLNEAYVSRLLSTDGTKHNCLIGFGTMTDCIAFRADPPSALESGATFYVGFMNDPTGKPLLWERCGAIQPNDRADPAYPSVVGWIAHAGTVGPRYATATLRQCWGDGPFYGGHPGGAVVQLEEGCHWKNLAITSIVEDYDVRYTTGYVPLSMGGIDSSVSPVTEQSFAHSAYYYEARTNLSPPFMQLNGRVSDGQNTVSFDHFAAVEEYHVMAGHHMISSGTATGGTVTANYSTFAGATGYCLWIPTGVGYVGDHNIFWTKNQYHAETNTFFNYHLVDKDTLALWQAATGQDANSCYIKYADQVPGGANALWLGWAEAPAFALLSGYGPAVGDYRINPNARVYSGANVAFIGTFPDGVPITNAGPQMHWHWIRREAVAGPPRAWPTPPTTLEQSRTYIRNPRRFALAA